MKKAPATVCFLSIIINAVFWSREFSVLLSLIFSHFFTFQGIETPEWVHTPHTEVFEMNLKDYCQSKAEEDYLKDIRRRIKNRESAKRSRLKKFKSIEQLREEYRILRKKEQEIRAEKRDAEEYCKYWESQVQALEREKYFLEDRKRRRLYSADM